MGEILRFPTPESDRSDDVQDVPETEERTPAPLADEPERAPRARDVAAPASILAAQERRLHRDAEQHPHAVTESILSELRVDGDGWMDECIPAVTHQHFGRLSFLERWRRRDEIREFRERLEQYREPVTLGAIKRLLDEVQSLVELPPIFRMKERLGRICLDELEKRVPQEMLTASDIEAVRQLGVHDATTRGVEEERQRQERVVRPLRPRDGADDTPPPPRAA